MKITKQLAILVIVASVAATSQGSAQGMGKMSRAQVQKAVAGWPRAARDAAMYMMNKYGGPSAMSADMIVWGKTGAWKRTIVYRVEHQHNFPGPHTDVMQQWIDYKAPPEMFDELAQYDGSVVLERTSGEISARCDKEGANFLALNLANEIVTGKRSVSDARKMYGAQIMAMKAHKPAPYTEKFLFAPAMGGTGDVDHPEM
ncbi:MAG: hypothetical protein H0W86_13130 [Armatimonadetes bacterium]|nr:hypothetical protein [Armatimonadota bacterium]